MTGDRKEDPFRIGWVSCDPVGSAAGGRTTQPTSPTPEAALEALRAACGPGRPTRWPGLLGPERRDDLIGGDPAQARQGLDEPRPAAPGRRSSSRTRTAGPCVMARPRTGRCRSRWSRTRAGVSTRGRARGDHRPARRRATSSRRSPTCGPIVDAQMSICHEDHDGDEVLEYAQKLLSTPTSRTDSTGRPTGQRSEPARPARRRRDADYAEYREAGESYHGYNYGS